MRSKVIGCNYMVIETALGWLGVSYSETGLWGLTLPLVDRGAVMERLEEYSELVKEVEDAVLRRDLERYCSGERVEFLGYSIDWSGITLFRRRVLEETAAIPYGEVRSYKEIAVLSGFPRASRAVGGTMATNRLPLIIPCHRVIKSDGGLGGFGGGLALKQKLLSMEGVLL